MYKKHELVNDPKSSTKPEPKLVKYPNGSKILMPEEPKHNISES